MTKKKVIRKFGRENGNFFWEKSRSEILGRENFFRPPKLGARSPPLRGCIQRLHILVFWQLLTALFSIRLHYITDESLVQDKIICHISSSLFKLFCRHLQNSITKIKQSYYVYQQSVQTFGHRHKEVKLICTGIETS